VRQVALGRGLISRGDPTNGPLSDYSKMRCERLARSVQLLRDENKKPA
jgi:hypothetical protein